jgi:hypothetical protein
MAFLFSADWEGARGRVRRAGRKSATGYRLPFQADAVLDTPGQREIGLVYVLTNERVLERAEQTGSTELRERAAVPFEHRQHRVGEPERQASFAP